MNEARTLAHAIGRLRVLRRKAEDLVKAEEDMARGLLRLRRGIRELEDLLKPYEGRLDEHPDEHPEVKDPDGAGAPGALHGSADADQGLAQRAGGDAA